MKRKIKILLTIGFLGILYPHQSKATHGSALEIYYYWVSDSTYNFTLTFYRSCQGSTASAPTSFTFQGSSSSTGGVIGNTLNRLPTTGSGVPPLEPPNLLSCAVANTLCFEEYVYRKNITMPNRARDWEFRASLCCIPTEVDNISTSGSIEGRAGLNNLDFPDTIAKNISPVWHTRRPNIPNFTNDTIINYPILTFCEKRQYILNQRAKEYQGDRVKYEFTIPNGGFVTPYTLLKPLPQDSPPAFTIDSATGSILFKPIPPDTAYGNVNLYLINIKATEYRMDSVLVSGNYVPVERIIGYQTRNIFISTTDSASCPDLNFSFSDSTNFADSVSNIDIECDNNPIEIGFTDAILCNSIDSNGSNVLILNSLTLDTVKVISNKATNCIVKSTQSFKIYLDSILAPGEYFLMFKKGSDGNTVISECGLELPEFEDTLTINVTAPPPIGVLMGDTIYGEMDTIFMDCNGKFFDVRFTEKFLCNTIEKNASDFRMVRSGSIPFPVAIKKAVPYCFSKTSKKVRLNLFAVRDTGTYILSLVHGSDSNSVLNECYQNFDTSTIIIKVRDIDFDLGPDFTYCDDEVLDTTLDAGTNFAAYLWNNGNLGNQMDVDTAGTYWVRVTTIAGCSKTDTIHIRAIDCYVGINKLYGDKINIYPNPATEEINIAISDNQIGSTIVLLDINGSVVYEKVLSQKVNKIQRQNLKSGIYLVKIMNGKNVYLNQKLILE